MARGDRAGNHDGGREDTIYRNYTAGTICSSIARVFAIFSTRPTHPHLTGRSTAREDAIFVHRVSDEPTFRDFGQVETLRSARCTSNGGSEICVHRGRGGSRVLGTDIKFIGFLGIRVATVVRIARCE